MEQKSSEDETEFRALKSLANSSGNSLFLKDLPDSIKQKNQIVRERFAETAWLFYTRIFNEDNFRLRRVVGLEFSDVPTSADISRAKRAYEIQLDVKSLRDSMDPDEDLPLKKKRAAAAHANAAITGSSSSHAPEQKPPTKPYYEDEESEF